jgi:hypothetical protein
MDWLDEASDIELECLQAATQVGRLIDVALRYQRDGICRSDVVGMEALVPEITSSVPLSSFTAHPSETNVEVAVEGILQSAWKALLAMIKRISTFMRDLLKRITALFRSADTAKAERDSQRIQEMVEDDDPLADLVGRFDSNKYAAVATSMGCEFMETHSRSLPLGKTVMKAADIFADGVQRLVEVNKRFATLLLATGQKDSMDGVMDQWKNLQLEFHKEYTTLVDDRRWTELFSEIEVFAKAKRVTVELPLSDQIDVSVRGLTNRHSPSTHAMRLQARLAQKMNTINRTLPAKPREVLERLSEGTFTNTDLGDVMMRLHRATDGFVSLTNDLDRRVTPNLSKFTLSESTLNDFRDLTTGFLDQLSAIKRLITVLIAMATTHRTLATFKSDIANGVEKALYS